MATSWFHATFGFVETDYSTTKSMFALADDPATGEKNAKLVTRGGKEWYIGRFTVNSVAELEAQCEKARAAYLESVKDIAGSTAASDGAQSAAQSETEQIAKKKKKTDNHEKMSKGMKFSHVVNTDVRMLLGNKKVCGGGDAPFPVFMAASQFNCLEFVGPGEKPEGGVSKWALDQTQGPAVALCAPAATAFRNYFAGRKNDLSGQGGDNQLNTMCSVEELIGNDKHKYWKMAAGYLLPCTTTSMGELAKRIGSHDSELARGIVSAGCAGIHWNTECHGGRCAQVFASACPINYAKSTSAANWASFSVLTLEIAYTATLLAASITAYERGERVVCYLTDIGHGAFGVNSIHISYAASKAMHRLRNHPVDAVLVNYGGILPSSWKEVHPSATAPRIPLGVEQGVVKDADHHTTSNHHSAPAPAAKSSSAEASSSKASASIKKH